MLEAAEHFDYQLPEVFAGLPRAETPFPIAYPTAARPQAWAAGAPVLLLQLLLGLTPDRRRQALETVAPPELPSWVGSVRLNGVRAFGRPWDIRLDSGTVRVEEADEAGHRAVMRAQARDSRGTGTAAATITTAMRPDPSGTRVTVETDLQVSGPIAQFGRGVMQDVSGKLMAQFADCLAEEMGESAPGPAIDDATPGVVTGAGAPGPAVATAVTIRYEETAVGRLPVGPAADAALAAVARPPARERRTADVLDLGAASRGAVLKRALPVAAAAAAAVTAVVLWRRNHP
jgi:hypothetical protein